MSLDDYRHLGSFFAYSAIVMQIVTPDIRTEISLLKSMRRNVADKALPRAMKRCGLIAHRDAIRNAPRSPTQSQINNLRKTSKRRPSGERSTGRAKPGGLERSIEWRSTSSNAEVFVAANSEAGQYAAKLHDEKGNSWFKRGPGTVAKGAKADDKFIERAIYDNEAEFKHIINQEFNKVKL